MNKKAIAVFGSAVVVAVVIIVIIAAASGSSTPAAVKAMKVDANSFPVPANTKLYLPDSSVKTPPSYTKFWQTTDAIDTACAQWRELYRTWIGADNVGKVTGESNLGQSCSFSGPKDGYNASLQIAVYGSDPEPQVTLAITSK